MPRLDRRRSSPSLRGRSRPIRTRDTTGPALFIELASVVLTLKGMRLVSSESAFSTLVRLAAATALIAVLALGVPMHSHDLVIGTSDGNAPQKTPCAACVTSASPGLVSDRADFVPAWQPVGTVHAPESIAVAVALPLRSGRAPPAV